MHAHTHARTALRHSSTRTDRQTHAHTHFHRGHTSLPVQVFLALSLDLAFVWPIPVLYGATLSPISKLKQANSVLARRDESTLTAPNRRPHFQQLCFLELARSFVRLRRLFLELAIHRPSSQAKQGSPSSLQRQYALPAKRSPRRPLSGSCAAYTARLGRFRSGQRAVSNAMRWLARSRRLRPALSPASSAANGFKHRLFRPPSAGKLPNRRSSIRLQQLASLVGLARAKAG